MREYAKLHIDDVRRQPLAGAVIDLTDPATGQVSRRVALGGEADIDLVVAAASRAFPSFSRIKLQEHIELLETFPGTRGAAAGGPGLVFVIRFDRAHVMCYP